MSVETWLIVRRYDIQEHCGSLSELVLPVTDLPPLRLELPQDLSFADLKSRVRASIGLANDSKEVMKLRRSDNTLLTLSYLLHGNTQDNPYILEVSRVNQHNTVSARSALPPCYAATIRGKLASLETRVGRVESLVPEQQTRRRDEVERVLHQLGSKVHFLDKRLDELMPLDWRKQLTSA